MSLPPQIKKKKSERSRISTNPTQTDSITLKAIREEYHNPDLIAWLVGKANETWILVDDVECLALMDSGAQISTITIELVKQLGLNIHQLDRILKFETTGGGDIPYMGYVGTILKIPETRAFDEDIILLVIENSEYAQWVHIQLGALHIDKILNLVKEKEILQLNKKWRQSKIASLLMG